MELEKNGVREKTFLGVLVFGHPYCSSSSSIESNAEHESTCPFPCHIASSLVTFRDMYLHELCEKRIFSNFLYKIHHIYVYQVHKK